MRRIPITLTAFALTLAACGGGETSTSEVATLEETPATTSSTTPQEAEVAVDEAILDFVQCLRDEGLEVQDPDLAVDGPLGLRKQFVEEDGVTIAREVEAAFDACDEMRADMSSRFEDVDLSDTEDRLLAFSQCMREEGFDDFPDPDLTVWAPGAGLGPGNGPFGTVLTELKDAATNLAGLETCQAQYGGAGTGSSGTGE